MRSLFAGFLIVSALLAISAPARAGGWATVRLDAPIGDVLVDVPLNVGFVVLQHDVTPTSDVEPVLRATHKETAEQISISARQDGATGHFLAEVTFPAAGEWNWVIQPEPFGETSFETLTVLERPSASAYQAFILAESCIDPAKQLVLLSSLVSWAPSIASWQLPIGIGMLSIDLPLRQLMSGGHAIAVVPAGTVDPPTACGDIADAQAAGSANPGPAAVLLGLRDQTRSRVIRSPGPTARPFPTRLPATASPSTIPV